MSQKRHKQERIKEIARKDSGIEYDISIGIRKILGENWIYLAGLLLGIVLLYMNGMKGDFVSDDYATISQNPQVKDFSYMSKGFFAVTMMNYVIAKVFGVTSSTPFHLFSLVLYLGTCLAGFVFLTILFKERVARIAMLIFAVMPVHVEAVSWISGKPYLMNALMILISMSLFAMYDKTNKKKYLYWFFASIPIVFWFEMVRSLSLPFLIMLYLFCFSRDRLRRVNWTTVLPGIAAILTVAILILWRMIQNRISTVNSGYNFSESVFYSPFFQYPTAITKYLQLMFVPIDLTLYHTMYVIPVWLNWVVLTMYVALVIYFLFRKPRIAFVLAYVIFAMVPSMAPVKVSWLVAERYAFLGSLGFAAFLALILDSVWNKFFMVQYFLLASIVFLYGARVYLRNIDWQTNHNLWVNTCQVSPNSHNAWNNIGDDYDKLAQYENAIKGFTQSTIVKPNYADAFHNRANIFYKMGRFDLARDSYNTALSYSPGLFQTYLSLTQIDLAEMKYDQALEHSKKYLDMQPNDLQAWYVYGVVNAQAGFTKEAEKIFSMILQKSPTYKPAKDAMIQLTQQS
ncbi:MAG: tetratricopeptide repeat protein [Candidatus Shapirobacteria bacterium]|jgi:tetratricopeptide (TPR) repeat protein